MKFERLRLAGFKTFVDPTDVLIAPGLTGVVGPNGCGKSNLVEALRWVMGETSSKSLRGGGMDDVIFAGSGNRPERNHAEVSIRLSDPPSDLPGFLAGADQIEISRKIVREQGSTYRMNGREVRARDVQILFADAASGARSPSMVRQGQIGELIAAKPQHRRRILEDAAGIAGLHARRHEAELRLRQAEENLTRTEDVLGQLDRQMADLRRQAKGAERYRLLSAEIRELELLLLAEGLAEAEAEVSRLRQAHDVSVRAIATAMTAQGEAERGRAVAQHELDQARRTAGLAQSALQQDVVQRETLDSEIRQVEARLAELASRQRDSEKDVETARNVLADADGALAKLAAEQDSLNEAVAGDAVMTEGDRLRLEQAAAARHQAEADLAALQLELAEAQASRRAAEQRLQEARQDLARLDAAMEQARAALAQAERESGALAEVDRLQAASDAASVAFAAMQANLDEAERQAHQARGEEQAVRPRLAEAERNAQRLDTEARTIRKLVDQTEPGLWTPVIDLVAVQAGYETALASALGEDLEAAIETGATRHWEGAARDESLPPLPDGVMPALSVVEAPAVLHPRLSQIGIVTRADGHRLRAQLRQGQRLVSREGDLWRWDGFVARAEAPSAAARRLAERNRLAEVEAQAVEARTKRDAIRAEIDRLSLATRKAQESEMQAREALRRAGQAREQAQAEWQRALRRTEEVRIRLETARARLAALEPDRQAAGERLAEREAARAALGDVPQGEARLSPLRERVETLRHAEREATQAQAARQARIAGQRGRIEQLERDRAAWDERIQRARRSEIDQAERLARLRAEAESLDGMPATLAARRRGIALQIEAREADLRAAQDALALAEVRDRAADDAARQAMAALADAREASARLQVQHESAVARHRQMVQAVEEKLDAPLAELPARLAALAVAKKADPAQMEARLTDLRQDRDRLGAVNLRADLELQEIEAERSGLAREREDVTEAIRKFRRAIDALNSEGRQRLRAAFDGVNAQFQKLFGRLFGGGTAELQLIEADDPLEAGLEIIAKPPGKKPQLLSLLSGGEQALTATALIFAVFLTNPAPICVLDEVDAPLDDSNVERLCDLLHDMARDTATRFLVITHNPISMARMDRLYGVTMVERGVSQLVSVDLAEAERLAEAV
ncbi:MAG: chromosome segregation protein SMC [Beijerinckiaceae bacterium]|nr:chromosome segregation protein SMC [Beijerinckiaceae bacterium]MCZ8298879.1 chromosome segregation protein SMC [Beijerinckiaceae bacterium]